jgi:hypothetical protein
VADDSHTPEEQATIRALLLAGYPPEEAVEIVLKLQMPPPESSDDEV